MARAINGHRNAALIDYDDAATSTKHVISNILQNSDIPTINIPQHQQKCKKKNTIVSETEEEKKA